MPSYDLVEARFPTITRSDGVLHRLVPVPRCKHCYKPFPEKYEASGLCFNCIDTGAALDPHLARVVAATLNVPGAVGIHNEEIRELKEQGLHAVPYAGVLAQVLEEEGIRDAGLIVPIPPTQERGTRAGPLALADALAGRLHLPVRSELRWVREVRSQRGLNLEGRKANVDGAMRFSGTIPRGTTVLLVDDVITTGSTMREGARAVCAAGAKVALGIVAGRTARASSLEYAGVVVKHED